VKQKKKAELNFGNKPRMLTMCTVCLQQYCSGTESMGLPSSINQPPLGSNIRARSNAGDRCCWFHLSFPTPRAQGCGSAPLEPHWKKNRRKKMGLQDRGPCRIWQEPAVASGPKSAEKTTVQTCEFPGSRVGERSRIRGYSQTCT